MHPLHALFGLAWMAMAMGVALACPSRPLRIAFIDREATPFLVGAGAEFQPGDPGLMVTEVQAVLRRLGCAAELQRLPIKRLQLELTAGRLDVGIGLGDTPERVAAWQFPTTDNGQVDQRFAMGQSPIAWVTLSRRQPALQSAWQAGTLRGRLGAATASATALLAQRGAQPVEPVFEVAKVVQLLEMDRFDAIALPTTAYAQQLQAAGDRVALLHPPIGVQHYFAPTSRALAAAHGPWVRRFWAELCVEARQRPVAPACPRD